MLGWMDFNRTFAELDGFRREMDRLFEHSYGTRVGETTGRWETCLGCHDFHGNHAMKAPRRLGDAIPSDQIQRYFDGGRSPYPDPIRRAITPEGNTR